MEATRDLVARLDGHFDFVFNIAEGVGRRCREAVPAAVCELLGLPYTGSDPVTLGITLDKELARRVVSPDVPVALGLTDLDQIDQLRFPVIVKPRDEGSSKGIRQDAVCFHSHQAVARAHALRTIYGCPILVEEFLPGAEVTVAIAGNGNNAHILAMMEIAPVDHESVFLYSLERKREFHSSIRYHVPPRLPQTTLQRIERDALRAYHLLGCRDIARIDFRLDASGLPHFLECNPLPGLNPESGDLVIATRSTLRYADLVCGILRDAAVRKGVAL
ncbi:MAG: D-alanine--D-alanine ligase [Acidobacteria bacterium]|nr:D-alanine--D-alanine ligase [Acidobacteriota bacterium]